MSTGNGTPVTRAELAAHIKGIDENFRAVQEDIADIKDLLTVTSNQLIARQGQSLGVGVSFKVLAAVVAALGTTVTAAVLVVNLFIN